MTEALVAGYKLTDADKALIRCLQRHGGNIAAVHFDGKVLVDLLLVERFNPRQPPPINPQDFR